MDKHRGPNTINIEVKGVNHLEMNSHSKMRKKLDNILNHNSNGTVFNPRFN